MERHPVAIDRQQSARGRPDDKAQPERHPHQPEAGGALFRRGDVGDRGIGGGIAGARDPGDHPADHQPPQRRGEPLDRIVDRHRQHACQHHRSSPEAVGQIADHRREHELHRRIARTQPAGIDRSGVERDMRQPHDQLGHDGDNDPEPENVDQHDRKDKPQRGTVRPQSGTLRSALRH